MNIYDIAKWFSLAEAGKIWKINGMNFHDVGMLVPASSHKRSSKGSLGVESTNASLRRQQRTCCRTHHIRFWYCVFQVRPTLPGISPLDAALISLIFHYCRHRILYVQIQPPSTCVILCHSTAIPIAHSPCPMNSNDNPIWVSLRMLHSPAPGASHQDQWKSSWLTSQGSAQLCHGLETRVIVGGCCNVGNMFCHGLTMFDSWIS